MAIIFELSDVRYTIPQKRAVKKWLTGVIVEKKKALGDIVIVLCSDSYLIEMNKEYLQHNYPTDIITFNYNQGEIISGELYISIDTVKSNAKIFNEEKNRELRRVMVHGVLHLLGYDDHTPKDKKIMRNQEDSALKIFDDSLKQATIQE